VCPGQPGQYPSATASNLIAIKSAGYRAIRPTALPITAVHMSQHGGQCKRERPCSPQVVGGHLRRKRVSARMLAERMSQAPCTLFCKSSSGDELHRQSGVQPDGEPKRRSRLARARPHSPLTPFPYPCGLLNHHNGDIPRDIASGVGRQEGSGHKDPVVCTAGSSTGTSASGLQAKRTRRHAGALLLVLNNEERHRCAIGLELYCDLLPWLQLNAGEA
jgi:hypothetical protein